MNNKLVADKLIAQAQQETKLQDFDSDSYREGLEILIKDLNIEAPGSFFFERNRTDIVDSLATRLRVNNYLTKRSELLERPVAKPIFVFGVPRTGTTLLSNLLAADPAHRSPLTWEIEDPVPPPSTETLYTDPRALSRLEEERKFLESVPQAGKYYRMSATYPYECSFFMRHDFKALFWEGRGKLPNYRDWLYNTDMTATYQYHKRFLQLLQADAPGIWNLKMPSHGLWLRTLLEVYPDARLIWTHRDPLAATGSYCSLMSLSHFASTDKIHSEWIAENYSWQCAEHANRIMDAREALGHHRIIDVHYGELMRDPIPTMRNLYKQLNQDFSTGAENGMQSWLSDNPQDKFGRHEYKLDQFGLKEASVYSMFERYLSAYDVETEV
ncbi:MAG: sulfotransferase [Ketobacter sp.]|nr:MAG: sulfotransferase [Ketobacter sp.]